MINDTKYGYKFSKNTSFHLLLQHNLYTASGCKGRWKWEISQGCFSTTYSIYFHQIQLRGMERLYLTLFSWKHTSTEIHQCQQFSKKLTEFVFLEPKQKAKAQGHTSASVLWLPATNVTVDIFPPRKPLISAPLPHACGQLAHQK